MNRTTFHIPNISCHHCVMTIKNEISEIEGVSSVEGDPSKKEIVVEWDSPADIDKIKDKLKEINYPAD